MAKPRSPQYPVIGLEEAINKVRLVWEKDYTSELPREVIAEHMGYGSLNGKSLGVLAAVAKFGLLDGRGKETHVTDLAVQILAHEHGDEQRISAVRQASNEPKLFQEILEKFDARSPSDQALKSYLFTRGFTHSGVERVILAFRETETFVERELEGFAESEIELAEPELDINQPLEVATNTQLRSSPTAGVPTIAMSDSGLEIGSGVISTIEQYERLLRRLKAGRVLLEAEEILDLL